MINAINTETLNDKFKIKPVSGYLENNPNNIILDFEKELLEYCSNEPEEYQCVIVDSLTNALDVCLFMNKLEGKNFKLTLPAQTYISVYITCKDYGPIILKDINWENYYKIGNIIDSAAYLPFKELENIFNKNKEVEYLLLSFGNSKPLANNRGGAIIFKKDINKYNFIKRYVHNGRDSALKVEDDNILKINNEVFGKRYNLVPEQVKILLEKLKKRDIKNIKSSYVNSPNIKRIIGEE